MGSYTWPTFTSNDLPSVYIGSFNTLSDNAESMDNEITNARSGETTLLARLNLKANNTMTANMNGGGLYRLVSMLDAASSQDYVTLAQANSILLGGGSPGDIPITSLGKGTATANQIISINGAGNAVVGAAQSAFAVTSWAVGTLLDGQFLQRSGSTLAGSYGTPDYLLQAQGVI